MSIQRCKGTNCRASEENGFKHSSECRFDYARAVASGINSVSIEVEIPDHFSVVIWRGHRLNLESQPNAAPEDFALVKVSDLERIVGVLRFAAHPERSPHADALAELLPTTLSTVKPPRDRRTRLREDV